MSAHCRVSKARLRTPARTEPHSLSYGVPTPVTVTTPAIEKLLAADGWMQYLRPLEESGTSLLFKKGRQGLFVSFTQGLRHPDQSAVSYDANRINANVPFPADATNLMFDDRRPYLGCVSAATVDASLDFFRKETRRIRLVAIIRCRHRGPLAERQNRRENRERRTRLLWPGHSRWRPSTAADHAVAATPRRRQHRRRNQGCAVRVAAESRGHQGDGRPARTEPHPKLRKHR